MNVHADRSDGFTIIELSLVLIVLGIFSATSSLMPFSMEIDQAFIAAILTVIGYSLNDTVVVFDRIREIINEKGWKSGENVNLALNSTLSRTLNTSLTTLVVLLSIFVFGGETLRKGVIWTFLISYLIQYWGARGGTVRVLLGVAVMTRAPFDPGISEWDHLVAHAVVRIFSGQGRAFGILEGGRGVVESLVAWAAVALFARWASESRGLAAVIVVYSAVPLAMAALVISEWLSKRFAAYIKG